MSGYRSLHREQVLVDRNGATIVTDEAALWSVQSLPYVAPSNSSNNARKCWWIATTASTDSQVRVYQINEKDQSASLDILDASALSLQQVHALIGKVDANDDHSNNEQSQNTSLGCTKVCSVRNYVGEDENAGEMIVASVELTGKVRIWTLPPEILEGETDSSGTTPQRRVAAHEFKVENATGTTLALCPPRLFGVGDVMIAVGCLDGTISLLATGFATPKYDKEPMAAGSVLDTWGSPGSGVPLSLAWNMSSENKSLAVGRQDGVVDILTLTRKGHHRLLQHNTPVRAVAFTDDGSLLIAGSDEGKLTIWDVNRKVPVLVNHVLRAHTRWILGITVLPDSRRFVTSGAERVLHVWDVGQMHQAVHSFHTDHVVWSLDRVAAFPRMITASESGCLQVYSLES